jgi:hypothetical protein
MQKTFVIIMKKRHPNEKSGTPKMQGAKSKDLR